MSEEWVTVGTYQQHWQSTLAKSVLDAAGIQCWLRDEHVSRMYNGLFGTALSTIQLQVRPEDEAAALEALEHSSDIPGDEFPSEA